MLAEPGPTPIRLRRYKTWTPGSDQRSSALAVIVCEGEDRAHSACAHGGCADEGRAAPLAGSRRAHRLCGGRRLAVISNATPLLGPAWNRWVQAGRVPEPGVAPRDRVGTCWITDVCLQQRRASSMGWRERESGRCHLYRHSQGSQPDRERTELTKTPAMDKPDLYCRPRRRSVLYETRGNRHGTEE